MAQIIILNGTSSAGKTRLAHSLRPLLPGTFCYFASDQLADAQFRPRDRSQHERNRFFDGFHGAIAAFAEAGNDMIVEHIVETADWAKTLTGALAPHACFWVGVHCGRTELERREAARGDRTIGEAAFHLRTHSFCRYDCEVWTDKPGAAEAVARAWADWTAARI